MSSNIKKNFWVKFKAIFDEYIIENEKRKGYQPEAALLPLATFAKPPLASTIGIPMMNADATETQTTAIPTQRL